MFVRRMRWLGFSDALIRYHITTATAKDAHPEASARSRRRLRMTALKAMEKTLREPKRAPLHERN
jgi:hypothetical protein